MMEKEVLVEVLERLRDQSKTLGRHCPNEIENFKRSERNKKS